MKSKIISISDAIANVKDGMTLMIGGFLGNGTPCALIDELVSRGIKDLTIIANDSGVTGIGISKIIAAGLAKKVIASHIGTNPETGRQMNEGILDVRLVPQGTLAEQIRAGGNGLGGILTPTGIGTSVAEGKKIINIDGTDYILELPLRADVALVFGSIVDEKGNVYYKGTTRNFNPLIATAADTVIVEAEKIVSAGEILPENVMTSCIFVDYICGREN